MVDYKYKDLFYDRSVKKSLRIYNDDETLVLTNSDIHYESFELTESISSEPNLVFGSCEPSMVKFRVSNIVTSLKNQWLTVSETLEGGADEPFLFGRYKVFSDELTSDRKYRDITAYDALHDALEVDLTTWYNTILPNDDSEVTQKQFRDILFDFLGIEQEYIVLPNDDMIIQRTIQPEQLFGFDVLTALCEINGCFGHIGRNGNFQYIFLKEMIKGLYPSTTLFPSENLFPATPLNSQPINKPGNIRIDYEDFIVERINKLQIRQEEDDIGVIYPDTEKSDNDNCYIVQDNFLVYGKSSDELRPIAEKLLSVISKVWYRPAHVEAKGNPCLEVGDGIRLSTSQKSIYTYILQRTIKGIQALRDTYDADGEQYHREEVNGTHKEILQLKGKTNVLVRTIEETRLEMADIENGLSTRITANAGSIEAEVKRAFSKEAELSASIKLNSDSITAEVTRAKNAENELSASIKINSDSITAEVTRAQKEEGVLRTNITQTAESITAEVTRAQNAENSLSSRITQNANAINLRVQKGSIISEINQTAETVTIKASRIDLAGLVSATEFTSKFATIDTLNASIARIATIEANYASVTWVNANFFTAAEVRADFATISELNSAFARISTIESDYINTGELNAVSARVNTIYSDYVKASTLGDDVVTAISGKAVYLGALNASGLINANGGLTINGYDIARKTATISGVTINYWGWE